MKIYTKIILDKNNNILLEHFYDHKGRLGYAMGIHYDYKSTRSAKQMQKQAKREKKLAERRAKKEAKLGDKKKEEPVNKINTQEPITLDFITNPNKVK